MEGAKTETAIDSSWWSIEKLETKIKKEAPRRRARRARMRERACVLFARSARARAPWKHTAT